METKMITIPFEVEKAKRIQAGEEPGKIVTRDDCDVRIVCWDVKDNDFPIVAALTSLEDKNNESVVVFKEDGRSCHHKNFKEDRFDLILQVPEWTQYKEGDVLEVDKGVAIIFNRFEKHNHSYKTKFFAALGADSKLMFPYREGSYWGYREYIKGYANEEQKQQFVDALKASTDPLAKEYLKRFFGIEEKPEYKFEPFDKVLVRMHDGVAWEASLFSHLANKGCKPFMTVGGIEYEQCIPYNEQTKHLLGTTDNWEE